jgi:hypothetical protein
MGRQCLPLIYPWLNLGARYGWAMSASYLPVVEPRYSLRKAMSGSYLPVVEPRCSLRVGNVCLLLTHG